MDHAFDITAPHGLGDAFFHRPTLVVARELLGVELSTVVDGAETAGIIVEVEAYGPEGDLACHGARGRTDRNKSLFAAGGHCYVYLIYGVHYCVNVVTEGPGVGCGVLIRAIEPTTGIATMAERRKSRRPEHLTSGPGKVCQALGIDLTMEGHHYETSELIRLRRVRTFTKDEVSTSSRIGISKAADRPWRYYVTGNPFVNGAKHSGRRNS